MSHVLQEGTTVFTAVHQYQTACAVPKANTAEPGAALAKMSAQRAPFATAIGTLSKMILYRTVSLQAVMLAPWDSSQTRWEQANAAKSVPQDGIRLYKV